MWRRLSGPCLCKCLDDGTKEGRKEDRNTGVSVTLGNFVVSRWKANFHSSAFSRGIFEGCNTKKNVEEGV